MYNTDLPSRAELPSSRQLIRSTIIALVAAGALLTTTVLPAEYGIDPTGIGNLLGLTQMGRTKTVLAAEAATDAGVAAAPSVAAPIASPVTAPVAPPVAQSVAPPAASPPAAEPAAPAAPGKRDEMTLTLRPGQAAEVKLDMRQGDKVDFSWQISGGAVNFDTHGDPVKAPRDFYHGYGKGRDAQGDKGTLQAAFDGQHGWFWRNRGKADVSVTLKTQGQYSAIKRVL